MPKDCIICGKTAGSGEHVFPASFGGRRTNNGIYCEKHNNDFGRHVSALLAGADIFNALIGVVPDRKDEVRPAPAASADGETFLISGGKITRPPPPPLSQTPELLGQHLQMGFANEAEARKWIAEQQRAGYKVPVGAFSQPQTKLFGEPLRAERTLGGEDFMRGLLYIALTFVAHTDPDLARSDGLAKARLVVDTDGAVDDRVLWEPPSTLAQITANPFVHGHTVVTGPGANGRRLVALISLYGAINFGIDLGEIAAGIAADRVITHIDPLAARAPHDVVVTRERAVLILSTPRQSEAYLGQLRTGDADLLSNLLHDASKREVLKTSRIMLKELETLLALSAHEQISRVVALLSGHDQRIFNWMRIGFLRYGESDPNVPEPIRAALQIFVSMDNSARRGLAPASEAALEIARALLTDQIIAELKNRTLDAHKLASLIGGIEGLRIVLIFFLDLIAKQMRL